MNYVNIKSVNGLDTIQFFVSINDIPVEGILGCGIHYNWIALPKLKICCELAHFDDSFWNFEILLASLGNELVCKQLIAIIRCVHPLLKETSQSFFDGKNYLSTKEYIYYLECECESLSIQLAQADASHYDDETERLEYYQKMRSQFGTDPL